MREVSGTRYYVSDCGLVFGPLKNKGLKQQVVNGGYKRVCLSVKGKKRNAPVHRLVLSSFRPIIEMSYLHVDHIDGNPGNNRLENLRWVTPRENEEYKCAAGRQARGSGHGEAKLTESDVINIRRNFKAETRRKTNVTKLANEFGVSRYAVWLIVKGKTWTHISTAIDPGEAMTPLEKCDRCGGTSFREKLGGYLCNSCDKFFNRSQYEVKK